MKWVLCVVIICCSTYIGYSITNFQKKKKLIYEDMIMLCNFLENSISFSMDTIQVIINNHISSFKSPIRNAVEQYVNLLEKAREISHNDLNQSLKNNYLDKNENIELCDFFYNLGRLGREEQIKQISAFKSSFDEKNNLHGEKVAKNSGIHTKIGFFVGLLIAILLM